MAVFFKNNNEDIRITEKNEDFLGNINYCRSCEKEIFSDKVRERCQFTSKYRGPAHSKCNINGTLKQRSFIPFRYHNFSNYDYHLFFKKIVVKKIDKVKIDIIPKTNEEYIAVTYGYLRFFDIYRFFHVVQIH